MVCDDAICRLKTFYRKSVPIRGLDTLILASAYICASGSKCSGKTCAHIHDKVSTRKRLSALLGLCELNLSLLTPLLTWTSCWTKQLMRRWFATPWRYCDVVIIFINICGCCPYIYLVKSQLVRFPLRHWDVRQMFQWWMINWNTNYAVRFLQIFLSTRETRNSHCNGGIEIINAEFNQLHYIYIYIISYIYIFSKYTLVLLLLLNSTLRTYPCIQFW